MNPVSICCLFGSLAPQKKTHEETVDPFKSIPAFSLVRSRSLLLRGGCSLCLVYYVLPCSTASRPNRQNASRRQRLLLFWADSLLRLLRLAHASAASVRFISDIRLLLAAAAGESPSALCAKTRGTWTKRGAQRNDSLRAKCNPPSREDLQYKYISYMLYGRYMYTLK